MSRLTFFRQSGWMMIASFIGGIFMTAVHIVAAKDLGASDAGAVGEMLVKFLRPPLDKGAYGLFCTLVLILGYIGLPAAGLQTILAQQTAMAITPGHQRQLRRTIHVLMAATFIIWAIAFLVAFVIRERLLLELKIADPAALWVTLLAGLLILWSPMLSGVLQGQQNFLWLGWSSILGGFGRSAAIFVIVRLMGTGVTGAMVAVLCGILLSLLISAWQSRAVWHGPTEPFVWRPWLLRVLPLTLGVAATTFIMTADMIVVRSFFDEDPTGFYSAAGILGRALAYFTGPMTAVMFPKIVQSAARAERTDVLAQALGATALLGGAGALFCTILPEVPLRIMYDQTYLVIKPLVPWFAWCVLPLTLANVLINNLLARSRFAVVPWLVLVALTYGSVLFMTAKKMASADELDAFKTIVRILGLFGVLALIVSAWFTWRTTEHGHPPRASTVAGAT
jgi:O-antigen/teichoic acid export membrane protein